MYYSVIVYDILYLGPQSCNSASRATNEVAGIGGLGHNKDNQENYNQYLPTNLPAATQSTILTLSCSMPRARASVLSICLSSGHLPIILSCPVLSCLVWFARALSVARSLLLRTHSPPSPTSSVFLPSSFFPPSLSLPSPLKNNLPRNFTLLVAIA